MERKKNQSSKGGARRKKERQINNWQKSWTKTLPLYQSGLRMLPSPMLNVHPVGKNIGRES